jgi:hypothetical protein
VDLNKPSDTRLQGYKHLSSISELPVPHWDQSQESWDYKNLTFIYMTPVICKQKNV